MRGERLRPPASQARPVHIALAAVAAVRRDLPRGVRRGSRARLARPPADRPVRHRGMRLRAAGPRDVPAARPPVALRGMPGPAGLAGIGCAAAAAGRAAAGLPDRLLQPVGAGHVGVLPRPPQPVGRQRASRRGRVRRLLRNPRTRPGAHRPAAAARRAPAGGAVCPAVPRRRAERETAAPGSPPARAGPGRRGRVLPTGTARRMVGSPRRAENRARLAPVRPRRAPPD